MSILEIRELYKSYGSKEVLKGIDLNINAGEAYGLLGKNGAGKTTLNRIITGLAFASKGKVNCDCRINFLSENIAIYPEMSAYDNLVQMYLLANRKAVKEEILKLLAEINIDNTKKEG